MPEMGKFGVLMAIGIGYSLVFSIIGLPALLINEERFVYYLKSKFKFGIEGEFHLEENK
jgi:predicted RND superfamily exporter protein